MWDFLRDVLKKNGILAIILLGVGYLLYLSMKQGAEDRARMFDAQMDYLMDVRVKLENVETRLAAVPVCKE